MMTIKNNSSHGSFYEFQLLCSDIGNEPSYNNKTDIIQSFVKTFKGDLYILCKLLLIRDDKRVFNIKEKQFVKLLCMDKTFKQVNHNEMIEHLLQGDCAETVKKYFQLTGHSRSKSTLLLQQVDDFLTKLTTVTKEQDQLNVISPILNVCTGDDLKYIWKLIDHDLKINIGPKFVFNALHKKAFDLYRNCNDLKLVIDRIVDKSIGKKDTIERPILTEQLCSDIQLLVPIKPMICRPITTAQEGINRTPNGSYVEIKLGL